MADRPTDCPTCSKPMTYVRDVTVDETKSEWRGTASGFSLPLASHIEECPEHGQFRVFVSGRIVAYRKG